MDAGRCTVVVGATSSSRVSRRHTRELRELLVQAGGARWLSDPPPQRVRVTGPPRRRAPQTRDRRHRRADPARRRLPRLAAARAAVAGAADHRPAGARRRLAAAGLPPRARAGRRTPGRAAAAVAAARRRGLPGAARCSAGATSCSAERNERDFAELLDRSWTGEQRRARASSRSCSSPSRRWLIGTWGLRFSRTTSDFFVASRTVRPGLNASAIGGEYLSAASFLGVAGLVLTFGADMLWYPIGWTAGYLCCWCSSPPRCAAPAPTRCPTSPRPGSARAACAPSARCWWSRSAGSTCCRSSRAPASPCAAAIDAPGVGRAGDRRRWSCSPTSPRAGCAASRSCRPSSTGSSSPPCCSPRRCC